MTSVLPKFRTNFVQLCHLSKSGAQWGATLLSIIKFLCLVHFFLLFAVSGLLFFMFVGVPNLYRVDKIWTIFFAGSNNQFQNYMSKSKISLEFLFVGSGKDSCPWIWSRTTTDTWNSYFLRPKFNSQSQINIWDLDVKAYFSLEKMIY